MRSFVEYRAAFRTLYEEVKKVHATSQQENHGHGLDHDVTVAQLASYIAPDERTAEKAWCASLLHSIDRLAEKETEPVTRACAATLHTLYTEEEIEEIIQAALRHAELNQGNQSLTQQVLMDADRLANLNAALPIRSGQFQSSIPALELAFLKRVNPVSTYSNPQSVLDDIRTNIAAYLPQLRLPKAQELGKQYAERLESLISWIVEQYQGIGLYGAEL